MPIQLNHTIVAARDAADRFDLGARDGLAIGDNREHLQRLPREPLRVGLQQCLDIVGVLGPRAERVAAREADHVEPASLEPLLQSGDKVLDLARLGSQHPGGVLRRERILRDKKQALECIDKIGLCHGLLPRGLGVSRQFEAVLRPGGERSFDKPHSEVGLALHRPHTHHPAPDEFEDRQECDYDIHP